MSLLFNRGDSADLASALKNDYDLAKVAKLRAEGKTDEADQLSEKVRIRNLKSATNNMNVFYGLMILIVLAIITWLSVTYIKNKSLNSALYAIDGMAFMGFIGYAIYVKIQQLRALAN